VRLNINKVHVKSEVNGNAIVGELSTEKLSDQLINTVKLIRTSMIINDLINKGENDANTKKEGEQSNQK
jgi:hypothetical protein